MLNRVLRLAAVVVAIAGVVGAVYVLAISRQRPSPSPMFLVYNDSRPDEALAVYLDSKALQKHDVSADEFEAAFRAHLDAVVEVVARTLVEMFTESSDEKQEQEATSAATTDERSSGLTTEAYSEILETARMEVWKLHPDGTHTVIRRLPSIRSSSQSHDVSVSGGHPDTSPREQAVLSISVPPTTLEEAKTTFARNTKIAWPEHARDIRFDERRVPFLGDGAFYVVFSLPPDELKGWLETAPPWDKKQWLRGPIPPEAGCHCGFGYREPSGYARVGDGPSEYSGGDPEIMAVLKSKDVFYAAQARGPERNPWYNGDIIILDTENGIVRYCSWDM